MENVWFPKDPLRRTDIVIGFWAIPTFKKFLNRGPIEVVLWVLPFHPLNLTPVSDQPPGEADRPALLLQDNQPVIHIIDGPAGLGR
jgi:hypothetical protein